MRRGLCAVNVSTCGSSCGRGNLTLAPAIIFRCCPVLFSKCPDETGSVFVADFKGNFLDSLVGRYQKPGGSRQLLLTDCVANGHSQLPAEQMLKARRTEIHQFRQRTDILSGVLSNRIENPQQTVVYGGG
jgi:hypothetical protein